MAKAKYTAIGGQALIEGIMMKSPEKTALAVRCPDKNLFERQKRQGARADFKAADIKGNRGIFGIHDPGLQGYDDIRR